MKALINLAIIWILAGPLSIADAAEKRLRLGEPWPSGAAIDSVRGEEVRYASRSPFSPAEIGDPNTAPATARAVLFLPAGTHSRRSVPAVVMLHGSGGVLWPAS